jgi:sugar phosphate isomerase/epimerase
VNDPFPWPVSALTTSLPGPFAEALRTLAGLGFTHADVVALEERPTGHLEALADSGLVVACAAVGRGLPEGQTLDAGPVEVRRAAVEAMKRQLADAARLGATHAYVVPGLDASDDGLTRFAEACGLLADFAAARMVRLCVEAVPGRALATAAGTLAWLDGVGHGNLGLLLDVGHCLITAEDSAAVVRLAGPRLGYLHFDDNDGVGDLHWPLLTGRLTGEALAGLFSALRASPYRGPLSLELNPANADPERALAEGKALIQGAAAAVTGAPSSSAPGSG